MLSLMKFMNNVLKNFVNKFKYINSELYATLHIKLNFKNPESLRCF